MRLLHFTDAPSVPIDRYQSQGAGYTKLAELDDSAALGVIRLARGGRLGRHPAGTTQLAIVMSGSGSASGGDGSWEAIRAGDVLLWEPGEEHETLADDSMLLLVLEAEHLTLIP